MIYLLADHPCDADQDALNHRRRVLGSARPNILNSARNIVIELRELDNHQPR